jgi:hypothetical protein
VAAGLELWAREARGGELAGGSAATLASTGASRQIGGQAVAAVAVAAIVRTVAARRHVPGSGGGICATDCWRRWEAPNPGLPITGFVFTHRGPSAEVCPGPSLGGAAIGLPAELELVFTAF